MNTQTEHTLLNTWKAYIEAVKTYGYTGSADDEVPESDIAYLQTIGAADTLIEAASFLSSTQDVNWAPNAEIRANTPAFLENSLIIGEDGSGNFIIWMDVSDPNSKMLYYCPAPATLMVIANSAIEWLEGLIQGHKNPSFEENLEEAWDNFFEHTGLEKAEEAIWSSHLYNGSKDQFGLQHTHDENYQYFDFTNAQPGAGIGLKYNGKYTKVEQSGQVGIVKLGVLTLEEVRYLKRGSLIFKGILFVGFVALFHYYNTVEGKSTALSLIAAMIGITVLGFLYKFVAKRIRR